MKLRVHPPRTRLPELLRQGAPTQAALDAVEQARPPQGALVAWQGDRPQAVVLARRVPTALLLDTAWGGDAGLLALLTTVRRRVAPARVEAVWKADSPGVDRAQLVRLGAVRYRAELRVSRALPGGAAGQGTWRPFTSLPEATQHELVEGVATHADAGAPPGALLATLRQMASQCGAFDPSLWEALFVDNSVAGFVLPQRDVPRQGAGTLLYLGVHPTMRGRGLGGLLFGHGLHRLSQAGLTAYEDGVVASNHSMQRLLWSWGCTKGPRWERFAWPLVNSPETGTGS